MRSRHSIADAAAAASAMECLERMGVQAAQNILDQFDGKLDPEMVVNQDVL